MGRSSRRRRAGDDGLGRQRPAVELSYTESAGSLAESSSTAGTGATSTAPTAESAQYWTVEVADPGRTAGDPSDAALLLGYSARRWKDSYGESLVEAAVTHGAKEWNWIVTDWGVVLELGFDDEADWLRFRATPGVSAALDAVPDPVNGLYVYPGRGGSSGARVPRRPRPRPQAGGAVPDPEPIDTGRPLGQYTSRPPTSSDDAGVPSTVGT